MEKNETRNWRERIKNASGEGLKTPDWDQMLRKLEEMEALKTIERRKNISFLGWLAAASVAAIITSAIWINSATDFFKDRPGSEVSAGMMILIIDSSMEDVSHSRERDSVQSISGIKEHITSTIPSVIYHAKDSSVLAAVKNNRDSASQTAPAVTPVTAPATPLMSRNDAFAAAGIVFRSRNHSDSQVYRPYIKMFNTSPVIQPVNNQVFTRDRNILKPEN